MVGTEIWAVCTLPFTGPRFHKGSSSKNSGSLGMGLRPALDSASKKGTRFVRAIAGAQGTNGFVMRSALAPISLSSTSPAAGCIPCHPTLSVPPYHGLAARLRILHRDNLPGLGYCIEQAFIRSPNACPILRWTGIQSSIIRICYELLIAEHLAFCGPLISLHHLVKVNYRNYTATHGYKCVSEWRYIKCHHEQESQSEHGAGVHCMRYIHIVCVLFVQQSTERLEGNRLDQPGYFPLKAHHSSRSFSCEEVVAPGQLWSQLLTHCRLPISGRTR